MLSVMKSAGLKKKTVKIQNVPARGHERQKEFDDKILALDNQIYKALKEGFKLVYLDECVFKARNFTRTAWSNPKQNLKVYDRTYKQPCQAISMAIDCDGIVA